MREAVLVSAQRPPLFGAAFFVGESDFALDQVNSTGRLYSGSDEARRRAHEEEEGNLSKLLILLIGDSQN